MAKLRSDEAAALSPELDYRLRAVAGHLGLFTVSLNSALLANFGTAANGETFWQSKPDHAISIQCSF